MREVYICECCGFVSTKLSEFKMVGAGQLGWRRILRRGESIVYPSELLLCPKCSKE